MTVRVRLQRLGRRNRPFYRVVVADSRSPRDGKFIELVGTYNPLATRSGVKEVTFKVDRIRYWISVGAQPSDRVAWLLGQFGILPPKVVPVAKTKQTMPRKEWKELKKQQAAGGKGFHTSARACSGAAQPFRGGGGCGEAIDSLSQVVAPAAEEAMIGPTPTQSTPSAAGLFELAMLRNTQRLSVGWGTGRAGTAGAPHDDIGGSTIADRLSQMSLEGSGRELKQKDNSSSPPRAALSRLHTVLASHLALLGPAAARSMTMVGARTAGADGPSGDAR